MEPIYEGGRAFLGNSAYTIKRIFMCRDDKYFYWRIDFSDLSPLWKKPKGIQRLEVQVTIPLDDNKKHLDFGFDGTNKWEHIWNDSTSIGDKLSASTMWDSSKSMIVGRCAISQIEKKAPGIREVIIYLARDNWAETMSFKDNYIDFSK
jgi:hypothetical protein